MGGCFPVRIVAGSVLLDSGGDVNGMPRILRGHDSIGSRGRCPAFCVGVLVGIGLVVRVFDLGMTRVAGAGGALWCGFLESGGNHVAARAVCCAAGFRCAGWCV